MELGRCEVAYLCGGPRRVALAAVVTKSQDGRVKISPTRHRIEVIRGQASHPVERAAGDELRRRGLLGRHSHLTSAGRKLRDELREPVPEGLRAAVLGTCGVGSELRKVPDAPDPPPGSALIPKRRGTNAHVHDEAPPDTDIPGCPGVPGRW